MAIQLTNARHTWTLFPVEVAVAAGPGEHNSAWASSAMAATEGGDGNTGKALRLSSGLDGVAPPGAETEVEENHVGGGEKGSTRPRACCAPCGRSRSTAKYAGRERQLTSRLAAATITTSNFTIRASALAMDGS